MITKVHGIILNLFLLLFVISKLFHIICGVLCSFTVTHSFTQSHTDRIYKLVTIIPSPNSIQFNSIMSYIWPSCAQNVIVWQVIKELHILSRYIVIYRCWNKIKLKFDDWYQKTQSEITNFLIHDVSLKKYTPFQMGLGDHFNCIIVVCEVQEIDVCQT